MTYSAKSLQLHTNSVNLIVSYLNSSRSCLLSLLRILLLRGRDRLPTKDEFPQRYVCMSHRRNDRKGSHQQLMKQLPRLRFCTRSSGKPLYSTQHLSSLWIKEHRCLHTNIFELHNFRKLLVLCLSLALCLCVLAIILHIQMRRVSLSEKSGYKYRHHNKLPAYLQQFPLQYNHNIHTYGAS